MRLISIILFAFLITACAKKNEVTIIAEFQTPKTHLTPELKKEINERLLASGFQQTHLESLPKNRFKIKFLMDRFDKARLAQAIAIFNIAELEFWDTYRMGEPPLESIIELLPEISGFTPNDGGNMQKEVLGILDDTRNAGEIIDGLQRAVSSIENLKLYRSEKHLQYMGHGKKYQVYLINTKGKSEALLTSKHITEAKAGTDMGGQPIVNFNFDKEGAQVWAEMTTKATENSNQAIALVLNGKVVSAPVVRAPILGGACQISGGFSIEETTLLAKTFNLGSFSQPMKIIEINEEEVN